MRHEDKLPAKMAKALKKKTNIWYGIHEVYYDAKGKPHGWTADSIIGGFDSVRELKLSLTLMFKDMGKNRPVLNFNKK